MGRIIAFMSAIATLAWALATLRNSGFSIDSLTPFHWYRRFQWNKKYGRNPLYVLDKPLDVAAVLLVGIARLEGEISREQKNEIISVFSNEFHLDANGAKELFTSSAFLLQHENNLVGNVDKVLENTRGKFTPEQITSTLQLMTRVANLDNQISTTQQNLLAAVERLLIVKNGNGGKWG